MDHLTRNYNETVTFGQKVGQCLKPNDIVLLFGDLGAGKTALTKGICRGLGITKNEYIRSPTFTLINEYFGTLPIYHVDLYRLESLAEIEALGLEEYLFSEGVSIIEWAEKLFPISNQMPCLGINERIEIHITIAKENHRNFRIKLLNQSKRTLNL